LGAVAVRPSVNSYPPNTTRPLAWCTDHAARDDSIERTFQRPPRALWPAAHVQGLGDTRPAKPTDHAMFTRFGPLVVVTVLLVACTAPKPETRVERAPAVCAEPPSRGAKVQDLVPGEYELVLKQTGGSKTGHEARGHLWLKRDPNHWSGTTLYGYVHIDLDAVDAPIGLDERIPPPWSTDPDAPGVRVWDGEPPRLTIGTSWNHKPREMVTRDGPGISLKVHRASREVIQGRWDSFGIAVAGPGVFCAYRVPSDSD
jgi:hypothetical protein